LGRSQKIAVSYFLGNPTWLRFEEIINRTVLINYSNNLKILRLNSLIRIGNQDYRYYLKILEYKLQNQIHRLDFGKDEISKILINKKRVSLNDSLQKELDNRAL
jgi:hypothetical protein